MSWASKGDVRVRGQQTSKQSRFSEASTWLTEEGKMVNEDTRQQEGSWGHTHCGGWWRGRGRLGGARSETHEGSRAWREGWGRKNFKL